MYTYGGWGIEGGDNGWWCHDLPVVVFGSSWMVTCDSRRSCLTDAMLEWSSSFFSIVGGICVVGSVVLGLSAWEDIVLSLSRLSVCWWYEVVSWEGGIDRSSKVEAGMMTEVLIACQNELQAEEAFGKGSKRQKESCCAGMKAATRQRRREGGSKTTRWQIEFGQFHACGIDLIYSLLVSLLILSLFYDESLYIGCHYWYIIRIRIYKNARMREWARILNELQVDRPLLMVSRKRMVKLMRWLLRILAQHCISRTPFCTKDIKRHVKTHLVLFTFDKETDTCRYAMWWDTCF